MKKKYRAHIFMLAPMIAGLFMLAFSLPAAAGPARLLRQPTVSADHIAFAYGGDLWIVGRGGGEAIRLTSTPAVESDPHLSPDGRLVAFSSNRSGDWAVYVMPSEGGEAVRLTWYPASAFARGWSPDGSRILYASNRETAPVGYDRLWTVSPQGGPSKLLPAPFGHRAWYSPDGLRLVVDQVSRWDEEWRGYRGGQNTPLVLLDLKTLDEVLLPNERSMDIHPVWLGERIFFLSDRDWVSNVWSYHVTTGALEQVTRFREVDVKTLAGYGDVLVFEQNGWIHSLDPASGIIKKLDIAIRGDFPWAAARWVDVNREIRVASLSATGKRAVMEARGEIFTVPVEHGSVRNLTRNSGAADRVPVWSPDGERVAWFSDDGSGYRLLVGSQDGLSEPRSYDIGESKMAWVPAWSPDGSRIAFVDDRVRIRVIRLDKGEIVTVDADGLNGSRSEPGPVWSPDSKWLAYAKAFPNNLRRIVVWSVETGKARPITDAMAHAVSPAWDRDGHHLWFLASTDLGLAAGWANTSSMAASPSFGAYVTMLRADDPTPFTLRSDEEKPSGDKKPDESKKTDEAKTGKEAGDAKAAPSVEQVRIDFDGIDRRIVALPIPVRRYSGLLAGPKGTIFIAEQVEGQRGAVLQQFSLESREVKEFVRGVFSAAVSGDGSKIMIQEQGQWRVVDTARPPEPGKGKMNVNLLTRIDPIKEWRQIFEESWHYQRDFFYDPNTHGADWDAVWKRYEPLVAHIRHRADLNYIIDMVNGELSVGHSFVGGGDMPSVETPRSAALGADLRPDAGRWRIFRIFTDESWNPALRAPLDQPGLRVEEGHFLLAVDGVELTDRDEPYRLLEGTRNRQTVLHINDKPEMTGAWTVTVEPIARENALRQRAWVEDNRRKVDELSSGRLAYVWVPNTGQPGVISFDRYYFSQQDRQGAVIDERFNGGGLLDDYMVDLMKRDLRAALTNESAGGSPMRLPAGVLGPKVLLINMMAGSGGDYFPWIFRKLGIGPLIGTRTWGGLVASCAPYPMKDGGYVTSPCNAVFEPGVGWVAENKGVPPDIEVRVDAHSVAAGRDPQLERAVKEMLDALAREAVPEVKIPKYSRPARRK